MPYWLHYLNRNYWLSASQRWMPSAQRRMNAGGSTLTLNRSYMAGLTVKKRRVKMFCSGNASITTMSFARVLLLWEQPAVIRKRGPT